MPDKAEPSAAARLLAEERAQIRSELSTEFGRVPSTLRRAANPLPWIRRFPLAAGGLLAAAATFVFVRRQAPRRPVVKATSKAPSWLHAASGELLTSVRRALTAALTARIVGHIRQLAQTPPAPVRADQPVDKAPA